ncbi:conserved hypothetical protein [Trichinella spiralis]|uniref:hypothetical protein n=1 Tax=Trichinella spiralis TaxID=6334 RepID=UPI0001EFB92A|nr:conserved hypothetical protein [Trichinella spiralis]
MFQFSFAHHVLSCSSSITRPDLYYCKMVQIDAVFWIVQAHSSEMNQKICSLANVSLLLCSKYTACCYLAARLVAFKFSKSYSTCRQACSEGRMWSEIIARPAIGHLTRAHHCERGDIGRRALNLPGYCLYRQCRFQHCSFCWPLAESVCFSLRSFSGQAARPVAELFRPLSMLIC